MALKLEDPDLSGDLDAIKALFRSYADWLETDHSVGPETHGIDREIENLPRPYAPPDGALIGARAEGLAGYAGCIALRRFDATTAEVKRLYVLPEARGRQIGETLVAGLLDKARALGYAKVILDVGDYQGPARALYAKSGFAEMPTSDHISYPGVIFMACTF